MELVRGTTLRDQLDGRIVLDPREVVHIGRRGGRRPGRRPPGRTRAPRHQAGQHPALRRRPGPGHRLRHRQDPRRPRQHPDRHHARHRQVPRAGAGARRTRRRTHRRLRPRRRAVRVSVRPTPVHRRQPGRHRAGAPAATRHRGRRTCAPPSRRRLDHVVLQVPRARPGGPVPVARTSCGPRCSSRPRCASTTTSRWPEPPQVWPLPTSRPTGRRSSSGHRAARGARPRPRAAGRRDGRASRTRWRCTAPGCGRCWPSSWCVTALIVAFLLFDHTGLGHRLFGQGSNHGSSTTSAAPTHEHQRRRHPRGDELRPRTAAGTPGENDAKLPLAIDGHADHRVDDRVLQRPPLRQPQARCRPGRSRWPRPAG